MRESPADISNHSQRRPESVLGSAWPVSATFDTTPAVIWILIALAAYGALRLVGGRHAHERDGVRLLFAWALFHATFYALLLPTPGHGGRYQPLTPLLFALCLPIGAAFVLRELARVAGAAQRRFAWTVAIAVLPWIVLAAPVAGSLRDANALAVAHVHATEIGAGRFVSGLPEGPVASFDIGGIGYASKRRVLDLGGLSDPSTAALLESGRISTWLEANKVRWIVLPQSYEPVLPVFEDYRARLHLADNPSLTLEPVRAFETAFDKWEPAIRATWNAAPKQVVYEVRYTGRPGPREVPMVPPSVRRSISDPAGLVPARERVVAEHMLATLAAWDLPVDLRVTGAAPEGETAGARPASSDLASDTKTGGPCAISVGFWGIAVDGCAAAGDRAVLRAAAYEASGRYLDMGDLGGALRAIPHVVAQTRRRDDPAFHPPLAPLMPPLAGGVFLSPMGAGRFGLALFAVVLMCALGIQAAARENGRLGRLVASLRGRIPALPKAALLSLVAIGSSGCGRHDVAEAASKRGTREPLTASGLPPPSSAISTAPRPRGTAFATS